MNNLSEFDRIIKGKIDSFEYPYEEASWMKFKKSIPGKNNFWGYVATFSIAVVSIIAIYWYLNTDNTNQVICNNEKKVTTNLNKTNITTNYAKESSNEELQIKKDNNSNEIALDNNQSSTIEKQIENTNNQLPVTNYQTDDIKVFQNNQKPVIPNANFTCDAKIGCSPLVVRFTPTEISDSMIYSWDFGDGTISTERQPSHTYLTPGNYDVLLMVKYFKSEPVIPSLQQNLVKVFETPTAAFTYNVNNSVVEFSNASIGAISYKWIFNDSESNDENLSKEFRINGKYSVKLIATNKSGCADTIQKNVDIKITHPIYIANAFRPNTEGQNSTIGPQVANAEEYYFVFEIYNKSGQSVFIAKGNNVNWDGINKNTGQQAEAGVYIYKLKSVDKHGNVDEKNGIINLLR